MPTKNLDEHRECYRRCFSTPDGKKVRANLLWELGWFYTANPKPELRNFACRLVWTMGFVDNPAKAIELVGKMFEISQVEE